MDKFVVRSHARPEHDDSTTDKAKSVGKGAVGSDAEQQALGSFALVHKKGDLFSCGSSESLAHCISLDVRMGKGIAVIFKKKFGQVDYLKDQCIGQKPGGLAVLKKGDKFVYYLLTKEKYHQKPTYATLRSSLEAMEKHCVAHNVSRLSMPKIGCGLDGLQWYKVEDIIKDVFKDSPLIITIYSL